MSARSRWLTKLDATWFVTSRRRLRQLLGDGPLYVVSSDVVRL